MGKMETKEKLNLDIRWHAYERGVPIWKIAEALGIGDNTVYRILRRELTSLEHEMFIKTIDAIHAGKRTKTRKEWIHNGT